MRIRPATMDDAQAVTNLVIAFDVDEYGAPDFELDDVLSEWASPALDLARDTWIVEVADGDLAGYAILRSDNEAAALVHPRFRGRGIGSRLLELVETRAPERAEDGGSVVVGQVLSSVNTAGRALLEGSGYASVRTYWRMVRDLADPPPEPERPEGVSVSTFDPERDARAVHALIQETFADNERHQEEPFEEWEVRTVRRGAFDPSLWFLAHAGDELVGCIVCPNYEDEGWVRQLGVRRAWRGRGVGKALLLSVFGEFHRRGRPHVGLGVDSWNRTGAKAFYENAGMAVEREYTRFEKELRAAR
jgi:mycothiol synthase